MRTNGFRFKYVPDVCHRHRRIAMAITGGRGTNFNVEIQLNRRAALENL